MPSIKTLLPHFALFIANLIYAANYIITKEVIPEYVGAIGMVSIRVAFAAIVFTTLHFFLVKEGIKSLKDILRLAVCALFGVAINQMLFFKGLSITNPINPAIIMTTTPILVLVASYFILKEPINKYKVFGVALGIIGAVSLIIISSSAAFEIKGSNAFGDLLVFINAISYGFYLVLVKPLMNRYHPLTIMRWVFCFGIIWVLPFGSSELVVVDWYAIPEMIYLAMLYIVLFVTVGAYFLNIWSLDKLSPTIVSFYIYLQPILASLIAIILGKDSLNSPMILCSIMIFVGVYLVSKK